MTDTTRDLIQRLANDLEGITEELVIPEYAHTEKERTDASLALVAEARAYLSQPEPEGPTDEEIADEARKYLVNEYALPAEITYLLDSDNFQYEPTIGCFRAVMAADRARWGSPAVHPETNGQA